MHFHHHKKVPKVLFILKKREMTYDEDITLNQIKIENFTYCMSSGLRNSAKFVVDMLNDHNIETKLVEVLDNNSIDREVYNYKPDIVVIEAFWVVPEKFDVLTKLHPKVKWIIRNHSEMAFLAIEGNAIDWSMKYLTKKNVFIAPNSLKAFNDTLKIAEAAYGTSVLDRILYLPNYYNMQKEYLKRPPIGETVDVGCFGAVRPLKNQLEQAIAAIQYAKHLDKNLNFHINIARIESNGNPVLKSLRGLFNSLDKNKYKLIEHGWLEHDKFLKLVAKMDIGMQVSFSESFNIVTADFVSQGVPIVVSKEIDWVPKEFWAKETDSQDIYESMRRVLFGFNFWHKARCARRGLDAFNKESVIIWTNTLLLHNSLV